MTLFFPTKAGGLANLICETVFYPIDTLKVRKQVGLQSNQLKLRNYFSGFRFFALQSIPAGNLQIFGYLRTIFLNSLFIGALYMGVYEQFKLDSNGEFSILNSIFAGAAAELVMFSGF